MSCEKEEDLDPTKISEGLPVTAQMYSFLRGSWTYKNPPAEWNWAGRTKIQVIDDSLIFIYNNGGIPPTDTFRYELRQYPAVNAFYYWSRIDSVNNHYEQYFVIKDQTFWLDGLDGLEMVRKQ